MKRNAVEISLVLSTLILLTLLINLTKADLALSGMLYGGEGQWPGMSDPFWQYVYRWAPLPGFALAIGALLVLIGGVFVHRLKRWRRPCLFLVLLLAIGPGMVVNVMLKGNLGRARPREVVQFGGQEPFSAAWQPGTTGSNSSFPSGHASVGYYLIGPWFLLRRRHPVLATTSLVGGLAFGSLVGVARVYQGGHFLSDVVWAGGLVYLVGAVLIILLESPVRPVAADELPS